MTAAKSVSQNTLTALQELQNCFDLERGLHYPGAEKPSLPAAADSQELQLRRLEFAALALAGEVGELANCIKKARRASWHDPGATLPVSPLTSELADVLAYLLKFSNDLGCDLEEAYLDKMTRNCLRFPGRSYTAVGGTILYLNGPLGAGKTSVAKLLEPEFATFIEDVSGNPYLPLLLQGDSDFNATANQQWFLEQRDQFLRQADCSRKVVMDQAPHAVVQIYARFFKDDGQIPPTSFKDLMLDLLDVESRTTRWERQVHLFLDAPAERLRSRALEREYSTPPPLSWYEKMRVAFIDMMKLVPDAVMISTENATPHNVAEEARMLLG